LSKTDEIDLESKTFFKQKKLTWHEPAHDIFVIM
jgi:hypothetical protein